MLLAYVWGCSALLNCAAAKPKPCSAAALAQIHAECLALEAVGCPSAEADGGQGGASPADACREVRAVCASRIDAWEDCR